MVPCLAHGKCSEYEPLEILVLVRLLDKKRPVYK